MNITTREELGSGGSTTAKKVRRREALRQFKIRSGFMQVNRKQRKLFVNSNSFTANGVDVKPKLFNSRSKSRSNLGQSLVEFALVLPILILIIYGVFDLGRAFYAIVTISNASREGARYMTRHDVVMSTSVNNSLLLVRDQIKQEALGSGIVLQDTLITIDCVRDSVNIYNCENGQDAWVRVRYDFIPLFAAIFPTSIRIGWETRMMIP